MNSSLSQSSSFSYCIHNHSISKSSPANSHEMWIKPSKIVVVKFFTTFLVTPTTLCSILSNFCSPFPRPQSPIWRQSFKHLQLPFDWENLEFQGIVLIRHNQKTGFPLDWTIRKRPLVVAKNSCLNMAIRVRHVSIFTRPLVILIGNNQNGFPKSKKARFKSICYSFSLSPQAYATAILLSHQPHSH